MSNSSNNKSSTYSDLLDINTSKSKTIRYVSAISNLMAISSWLLGFYFEYTNMCISTFRFLDYNNLPIKFEMSIVVIYFAGFYVFITKLIFIYYLLSRKDEYIISILSERANYFYIINDMFMSFSLVIILILGESRAVLSISTSIALCALELVS